MRRLVRTWLALVGIVGVATAGSSCHAPEGCMGGDDGSCVPPSACSGLSYQCSAPRLELSVLHDRSRRPAGLDAAAVRGDVLIGNDRFEAVLDALGSPHFLAPTGGSLLDFVPRDPASGDQLNLLYQAVGILPDDAVAYTKMELHDDSPRSVWVVLRGHLDGRPKVDVVTRYEARPCEPGLRVRTELYQGSRDPLTVFLSDAWFWGERSNTPFVPLPGEGFVHSDLDLEHIDTAFRDVPFMAAQSHTPDGAAYAEVACQSRSLSGFNAAMLSAAGVKRTILMPGDSIAFDRFLIVEPDPGLSGAASAAMEARHQLFGERYVQVSGRTVDAAGKPVGGDERRIDLLFSDGTTPWNEAVPDAQGRFSVRLPAGHSFDALEYVLGRTDAKRDFLAFSTGNHDLDLGDLVVPQTGRIAATVDTLDGKPTMAELVVVPTPETRDALARERQYWVWKGTPCSPYLGPPYSASPSCNRVLVGPSGETSFMVPAGTYDVYATHGPFWSLARARVSVQDGKTANVSLALADLSLLPPKTLSGDFHVHSGASFDSSLPLRDRAITFATSGLDVVAATDHNLVTNYDKQLADLGIAGRVKVMPGVESTGHILFLRPPGSDVPKVIGHFNFWPLRYDRDEAHNGAPYDQKIEPGELFDRMDRAFTGVGIRQLNHPADSDDLGRDSAYLIAIGYDPRVPVPPKYENTPAGQLRKAPAGGHANIDFNAEEVMNGCSVMKFLRYRTIWFSFLSQGILATGTANSDSHSIGMNELGYPRNLVSGETFAGFDQDRFNSDVLDGRVVGTNGPVLSVCLDDTSGSCRAPSREPFKPAAGAALHVEVRGAPWIGVQQIRVIVNGKVRKVIDNVAPRQPADALSATATLGWSGQIPLSSVMPAGVRDAWVLVEAGDPLPIAVDTNNDGLPNHFVDKQNPPSVDDQAYYLDIVAPGCRPAAFTNPLFVDLDGDGWKAPGIGR